jgi:hypothetical protein
MMVAIAILLTMLTIILVPLRLGLDSYALGKSRSETQGSLGVTISAIEKDLRRAVIVFPNSELAGVTDKAPYKDPVTNFSLPPYYQSNDADKNKIESCLGFPERISNPSRIDMILAKRDDATGNLVSPIEAGDTLVTYYSRRLDITRDYDPIDNPVVLFRSEVPFRDPGTRAFIEVGSAVNAQVGNTRYPTACNVDADRSSSWLGHNFYGEANLEPLSASTPTTANMERSHSLAMPRGLGLVVTNANCTNDPCIPPKNGLIPESTFSTADTDGDGKIDRVNVSLAFTSFDAQGSNRLRNNQPVGQQLRASRTVDLPNIQ